MISNLPFKGSRTYLHGTDTYNWIVGMLPQLGFKKSAEFVLKLSFHRRFSTQLILIQDGKIPENALSEKPCAEVEILSKEATQKIFLYDSGIIPALRVPYDEESITSLCRIDGKTINILGKSECTPIELVVAMTKKLHQSVIDSAITWAFVRLELRRLFEDEDKEGLEVAIVQSVQNRFTKSKIMSRGEEIGSIYFSAW